MSKGKSTIGFILVTAIIVGLAYLAAFGLTIGDHKIIPQPFDEERGIRQGLDLVGGSVITFEAQADSSISAADLNANMDIVVGMLRQRLGDLGLYESQLTRMGEKRVRIEIPSIQNPEEAVQKLGSTALLTFEDFQGTVVLQGTDIKAATAEYAPVVQNGPSVHYVRLEFTSEAAKKFAEATERISKLQSGDNYLAIKLDGEPISKPSVSERIDSDSAIISGGFTNNDETSWLANLISAGKLPFALKEVELRAVGPQLGDRALETSLRAAMYGIIVVMLFMLLFYRAPGAITSIALVGYIAIVVLILTLFRVNLSLPGIAGIILSIGMAVDANIVIFERVKEELRSGKSVKASINAGFKRAFTAILDANITTVIAAVVLYLFGTGPLQSFALTLFIGIVVSMFMALVITKYLLGTLVGMDVKNPKAYGI